MKVGTPVVVQGIEALRGEIGKVTAVEEHPFGKVFIDVEMDNKPGTMRMRESDVEILDLGKVAEEVFEEMNAERRRNRGTRCHFNENGTIPRHPLQARTEAGRRYWARHGARPGG
jgi:hypothetical protein